jgi:hypothetical protein
MDPRLAQALIGAAPEENSPDQLAIAQALAQQNRWGNLMSMSGDRALAPAGAAMVKNVAGQREGLQKARGDALDREAQERLAAARIQETQNWRDRQEGRSDKRDLISDTRWLSDQVDDAKLLEIGPKLIDFESKLRPYIESGENAPGVGNWYDRTTASFTDAGRDLQQSMRGLVNPILLERSGAAVTDPERYALALELGEGTLSNDQDIWDAVQLLKEIYGGTLKNLYAGVTPEAVDKYIARGGLAKDTFTRSEGPAATEDGSIGETYTDEDTGEVYRYKGGDRNDQNSWELVSG